MSTMENVASQIQKLSKNLANPKDKEKYLELKEKYLQMFLQKINQSNNYSVPVPKAAIPPYKYYVGRGNNSIIVKNCLKQRFWWSIGDFEEWHEYNFVWTQWKSNKVLGQIKSHAEVLQAKAAESAGPNVAESFTSTQATDKDSNSSVENILSTPTKRKRASTLPQSQQLRKLGSAASNSLQSIAQKAKEKGAGA